MGDNGMRVDDLSLSECYSYDQRPQRAGGRLRFCSCRHQGDHQKSLSVDETTGRFRCYNACCQIWGTVTEHRAERRERAGWGQGDRSSWGTAGPAPPPPVEPKPMAPHGHAVRRAVDAWKAFEGSPAQAYARRRGVPEELAKRLRLGYWRGIWSGEDSEWLTFPLRCPLTGWPVGVYGRNLHTDEQSRKGRVLGSKGLFGASGMGPMPDVVVVVEGPFEAIAVMNSAGLPAARALCGSSARPELFDGCSCVILLLDDDTPGHSATDLLTKGLADRRRQQGRGPQVLRLRPDSLRVNHGCKDFGEMLARGVPVRLNMPASAGAEPGVPSPSVAPPEDPIEERTFFDFVCHVFGPVVEIFDDPVMIF